MKRALLTILVFLFVLFIFWLGNGEFIRGFSLSFTVFMASAFAGLANTCPCFHK